MPATMPKKKPTPPPEQSPSPMPTETPDEATADRHKNMVVSFRPEAPLRIAFTSLAKRERRSMAQMIEILLEEALTHRGLWPAQAAEGEGA